MTLPMYLIYAPEDGERQEFWFDPAKMSAQEAEAIEKRTGLDWDEFGARLLKGNVLARRALLWTYLRRTHHTQRFEDVRFSIGEVTLELSREELERVRDGVASSDSVGEAERSVALAQLDEQIRAAPEAPGKASASNAA